MVTWKQRIATTKTLLMRSLGASFSFGLILFWPNLVSFPVYTTAPNLRVMRGEKKNTYRGWCRRVP